SRAARVRTARPGARQLLRPFADRRLGLFEPVLLTEAIAQLIAEADDRVPCLVPSVGPTPFVSLIVTLARAVGVGSSAGPGSAAAVRVMIKESGVRPLFIGAGRRRQRAPAQPDLIAHDVESGHLGAQADPASGGAHIGGELRGQCREVRDGGMG